MMLRKRSKRALILFSRIPEPGKTKTRMMPYLTADECADLQRNCLCDILRQAGKISGIDLIFCFTGEQRGFSLKKLCGGRFKKKPAAGIRMLSQGEGNLGERMNRAFRKVFAKGYDSCVLIGSDVPEIRSSDLADAFKALETKDVVMGKTTDGGYYLIGMKAVHPELFMGSDYSHNRVADQLVEAAGRTGLKMAYIRPLHDLDVPDDLTSLILRGQTDARVRHLMSTDFALHRQKISVIIPFYNEKDTIDEMIRQMGDLQRSCEIIFVDGGSTDGSREKIPDTFRVMESAKGRACQMNLGAQESSGDILFFLHCDSELPPDAAGLIRQSIKKNPAGCFGIRFRKKRLFLWTCRIISNHRVKDRRVMFGDQGIFVMRRLFNEIGGFKEMPLMEDYQFSLDLKARGVKPVLAGKRIVTSSRRFDGNTRHMLSVMWKMNRLRKMYRDGVPIDQIAAQYQDVR